MFLVILMFLSVSGFPHAFKSFENYVCRILIGNNLGLGQLFFAR